MSVELRLRLSRGDFILDVDLRLPGSCVSAVFGPSGCGKTSLLRAIAGLLPAPGGRIEVGGELWQGEGRCLPPHRRALGYVFQEPSLFPHLDVRGNLEFGLRRLRPRADRQALRSVVDLLDLGALLGRRPDQLSGGEAQRVAIARAVVMRPRLLLLDEPLAALDEARRQEILPYLARLQGELAIPMLYVTHSRDEVARLAEHLVLMEAGRVRASGPTAELFARLDLPLAHAGRAEAIIDGEVVAHDARFALSEVAFSGGRFVVARQDRPLGARVRLQVLAKDVSLTLERQTDTSILNIFEARVEAVVPEGESQVMVRLRVGEAVLLSRITRRSVARLEIAAGSRVFAQVKGVALLS